MAEVDIILDPSLFIKRSTFEKVVETDWGAHEITPRVPAGFLSALRDRHKLNEILRFYEGTPDVERFERSFPGVEAIVENIRTSEIELYEPDFQPSSEFHDAMRGYKQNLVRLARSEVVGGILWEEVQFLRQHSALGSRLKKVTQIIRDAGSVLIDIGRDLVEDSHFRMACAYHRELQALQALRNGIKWFLIYDHAYQAEFLSSLAPELRFGVFAFARFDP